MLVAITMSEPDADAGTGLTDLRTRVRVDGDEIVIIDGAKRWCSGPGHSEAYVVFCRFGEAPDAKGVGAVFVERDTKGLSFGPQERLMGFRGVPSADMNFDGVRVPRRNLVIGPGGFASLMGVFNVERLGNAAMSLGGAAGALDQVTAYVQERKQFGKPIADFQAGQIRLAEKGGYGCAQEYGMEQRFRDGWGWGIAGGAIDIQKVNIASELVGRRFDQRR
jgi:butyryl-CoA dehydrogenase